MDEVKDEIIVPAGRVVCHRNYEDIYGHYVAIADITEKTFETAKARCIESWVEPPICGLLFAFVPELVRMGKLIEIQVCDLSLDDENSFSVSYRNSNRPNEVYHHWPRRNP